MSAQAATQTAERARLGAAKTISREFGIPYTTLRDLAFKGRLPVIKFGKAWYFDRRDIEEFIRREKGNPAE